MSGQLITIIFLTGAACSSPVEQAPTATVAHKVPCAVIIREPVTNPFKRVQEPNEITAAKPVAKVAYKYPPKKTKKKKRKKR